MTPTLELAAAIALGAVCGLLAGLATGRWLMGSLRP